MLLTKEKLKKIIREEIGQVSDIRKIHGNLQKELLRDLKSVRNSFHKKLGDVVIGAPVEIYDDKRSVGKIVNLKWDQDFTETLFEISVDDVGINTYNLQECELVGTK